MTRLEQDAIARCLRDALLINCTNADYLQGAKDTHLSAASRIADYLKRTHKRFNRGKFMLTCL